MNNQDSVERLEDTAEYPVCHHCGRPILDETRMVMLDETITLYLHPACFRKYQEGE